MKKYTLILISFFAYQFLFSQVTFTAKDFVPPNYGEFGYGVNMGAFNGWRDEQLADIAAGNPEMGITGLGANSVRVWLPDWFTHEWGYHIRQDAFQHYEHLGMKDNVVFIGDAAKVHRDSNFHCSGRLSESFKNLYEPIWDNGENDTPVNENNFYAAYIYNLVLTYGSQTKYWEVTNEPDTDMGGHATAARGFPNNWWENDPPPCETKWGAPIQHYVRSLRIAYEVVKSLEPEDYIAVGGLGNKTFLDAIMRNTDNPDDGSVSALYPHKGGAYFDCLSFHAYPHFDGSMRYWSDIISGFEWTRNSDFGIDGFFERMDGMIEVMADYGYTGEDGEYPLKNLICTETNLTRKSLVGFLEGDESQRNFIIKLMATAQMKGVSQVHVYSLADHLPENQANSDFDFMGLYENLSGIPPHNGKVFDAGIAFKSVATALKGYSYDPVATKDLNLSQKVRGVAFKNVNDSQIFVMWATAFEDNSEAAEINYSFPSQFGFSEMKKFNWNFSVTGEVDCVSSNDVFLNGSPIFLVPNTSEEFNCSSGFVLKTMPNPFENEFTLEIQTDIDEMISASLLDASGKLVKEIVEEQNVFIGKTTIPLNVKGLASGIYFLSVRGISGKRVLKMFKR